MTFKEETIKKNESTPSLGTSYNGRVINIRGSNKEAGNGIVSITLHNSFTG